VKALLTTAWKDTPALDCHLVNCPDILDSADATMWASRQSGSQRFADGGEVVPLKWIAASEGPQLARPGWSAEMIKHLRKFSLNPYCTRQLRQRRRRETKQH